VGKARKVLGPGLQLDRSLPLTLAVQQMGSQCEKELLRTVLVRSSFNSVIAQLKVGGIPLFLQLCTSNLTPIFQVHFLVSRADWLWAFLDSGGLDELDKPFSQGINDGRVSALLDSAIKHNKDGGALDYSYELHM
jgi:hypothetical protein